jgi:uncharacterized protein (DUF58 family)
MNWFLIALAILFGAFVFTAPYLAFAVYLFLALVLLAKAMPRVWLWRLDAERTLSHTHLQQGEQTHVTVTVRNPNPWPVPWVYIEDHHPPFCARTGENRRMVTLGPGKSVTLEYTLTCPKRGYHRVGPLMMETGDLFGLEKRFRSGTRRDYFSVLPTVAYIETFNIASRRPQGPVRLSNRIYEDPTRINAVRPYAPGDPLKRIHWKLAARTGTLQVKSYTPSAVTGGTILLDLHEESYLPEHKEERIELAVTTAASLAWLLQLSGEQLGMATNARDAAAAAQFEAAHENTLSRYEMDAHLAREEQSAATLSPLSVETTRSPVQAQRIIENLARVLPGHGLDATGLVNTAALTLPRDAALLPIVPLVTEKLAWSLAGLKQNGFNVTVFVIKDLKAWKEASALLAPHHIGCLHIDHERALHEISPAAIGQ